MKKKLVTEFEVELVQKWYLSLEGAEQANKIKQAQAISILHSHNQFTFFLARTLCRLTKLLKQFEIEETFSKIGKTEGSKKS
mmetsp:Transcript_18363/g.28193  ORF Transcript_18363/g.28193 Transcript_18363/m.28193 type:complete len:82 (-) Transcript_18363:245-490(-)